MKKDKLKELLKDRFEAWLESLAHGTYLTLSEHDKIAGRRHLREAVDAYRTGGIDIVEIAAEQAKKPAASPRRTKLRFGPIERWVLYILACENQKAAATSFHKGVRIWDMRVILNRPVSTLQKTAQQLIRKGLVEHVGDPAQRPVDQWRIRIVPAKLAAAQKLWLEPPCGGPSVVLRLESSDLVHRAAAAQ